MLLDHQEKLGLTREVSRTGKKTQQANLTKFCRDYTVCPENSSEMSYDSYRKSEETRIFFRRADASRRSLPPTPPPDSRRGVQPAASRPDPELDPIRVGRAEAAGRQRTSTAEIETVPT